MVNIFRTHLRSGRKGNAEAPSELTTDELNCMTLRRWHYDHPKEYAEFLDTFLKAYEGDTTFTSTNTALFCEMLSSKGAWKMTRAVFSMFFVNRFLRRGQGDSMKKLFTETLDSSLNDEALRTRLLKKNPYLFSLYYWIVFDDGFLYAADLIAATFLREGSPVWEASIGKSAIRLLIGASVDKARYSKSQWKEAVKKINGGEAQLVIQNALTEVQGRRGRKKTIILLEEMLKEEEAVDLVSGIERELSGWRETEGTDNVLAYIFAALVKRGLVNGKYNYRTFHSAMLEKFPEFGINKNIDWPESLYNAILDTEGNYNTSLTSAQINKGKSYTEDVGLRLLAAANPNIS